ncbi:MAG: hypothetical protein RL708_1136 [Bacteroidota bacterium]|jgi:CRISPR-associated endonuclease Csn1
MKFKQIIGLDMGTNSLGWSLLKEFEDGTIEIVKTGVYIFPIGTIVDDKSGKEKTHNEQRRAYRGASRMRFRFKMRRGNLKEGLEKLGMLPDYSKLFKAKGKGQSYELYQLRANAINAEIKIPLNEIGRIFMLLNKYRGFKSNAKKIQQEDKEDGKVKEGINELKKFMENNNAKTIGEYFFKMHQKAKKKYDDNKWHNFNEPIDERAINENGEIVLFNSNGIRRHFGRYTQREMYLDEFDQIWEAQMKHYPNELTGSPAEYKAIKQLPYKEKIENLKEFKATNYWHIREYCIYYQRPLKSQKKYVSNCQFEKNKKAIPVSHPLYQEFRIYKNLADIRFNDEEHFNQPLKKEWIEKLAAKLETTDKLSIKPSKATKEKNLPTFFSVLGLNENEMEFVTDNEEIEKSIYGNRTYAAIFETLGEEKYNDLKQQNRLEALWHHLYMAKDGLMKEDEWLEGILTEKTKWNFDKTQASELISKGLEPDYGSYSTKVLKKVVEQQKQILDVDGNIIDERRALNLAKYLDDENKTSKDYPLKEKIKQLKYQELRNPVVEKSVSKSIKIVNAILENYKNEIDRETLEIRIESTRELKKPRQEREKLRKENSDKDKLREQYADFLNSKKDVLNLSKKIEKYDGLIGKYELWLQMNMNEDDETFKDEFKSFSKITKQEDRLKHRLWLECGRLCPYTGKTINLTTLFSSEIEIEHIIPLSRSLDNSFNNKTLTFSSINKEKGSRTAYEYLKWKGEDELKKFKRRLKSKLHDFSKSKAEQFLKEKVDEGFLNRQLSNTSYIAVFTRNKMREVCRNVQFTNGAATSDLRSNDWSLSNLLDKIRYFEDCNIDMDEVYRHYYGMKKSLRDWYEKNLKTTDFKIDWRDLENNNDVKKFVEETKQDIIYFWLEVNKFNQFRNKSGKKDRSDHRHHAIDAFITACCSPKIIKTLSTYNAQKENENLPYRDKIEKCFDYEKLKQSISSILVCHYEKKTLIKKRINKVRMLNSVSQPKTTFAPQGSLHKETFYGKLKKPINQGFEKKNVYISRDKLMTKIGSSEIYAFEKIEDLNKIYDEHQKSVLEKRINEIKDLKDEKGKSIKPFSESALKKFPLYSYTPNEDKTKSQKGKSLPPLKSIRVKYKNERSVIKLPDNKYADNDGNYMMIFYEKKEFDKKGIPKRSKRDFQLISFWDAVKTKRKKEKLFLDETSDGLELMNQCQWLKQGDIVYLNEEEQNIDTIDWNDKSSISNKLFKVNELGFNPTAKGYAVIKLEPHKLSKTGKDKYGTDKFPKLSESLNAIKVRLSPLGEIIAKGEECF